MFEYFLRTIVFNKESENDQEIILLLKDKFKMKYIAQLLVIIFPVVGISATISVFIMQMKMTHTLFDIIFGILVIISYLIFSVMFFKVFFEQLKMFVKNITNKMYCSKYVLKGNAISKEDWNIIKNESKLVYNSIMNHQVSGYCYYVCFELLRHLKKGHLKFIAIKTMDSQKKETPNNYTIHVLYVNNGWCFDTYSERQQPLFEVLKRLKAKNYATFEFKDIEGKTYEEFKEEHDSKLKEWCKNNGCFVWTK